MKIERIEAIPFRVPFRSQADQRVWAGGKLSAAEHVLVRVYSDEGLVGLGEAPARTPIYGETQVSIVEAVEQCIAPTLVGLDPLDREKIAQRLARLPGNHTAKGSVDVAVHDLIGRALGVPLYKLLGGWGNGRVPMVWLLHLASREKMVADSVKAIGLGIKKLKIKASSIPEDHIGTVRAIREAVGKDVMLYVDANMIWSAEVAVRTIQDLAQYGLACIEEPVALSDRRGRKKVAGSISIPWLMDENVITTQQVMRELNEGIVGMISVKTPRTGFYESAKIIHAAELSNVPCIIGSQGETGVGVAASGHLAAAFANVIWMENANFVQWESNLLTGALTIRDGDLILPEGAGLGVDIDEAALAKYAVAVKAIDRG